MQFLQLIYIFLFTIYDLAVYIDSFNMLIRMLRWLESKFKVFNQRANRISDESLNDRLDFKCIILHAMNELVYGVPDVMNRREAALKVVSLSKFIRI